MITEKMLDEMLVTPSRMLTEDMKKIDGDIMVIGAGGKMGPSLCVLAKNAIKEAGLSKRVIAVSRFTDPIATQFLQDNDIETVSTDLLEEGSVEKLEEVKNIIFMAGRKFGTEGGEALTWAMNTYLPAQIGKKFRRSRIVAFSSGNVYPMMPIHSGGASEAVKPEPIGEYGMSCLGRERMFEYCSEKYKTPMLIYRLNYAVDLRYGVLHDIAENIMKDRPISVDTPAFNCIWQQDANEIAIRSLLHTQYPIARLNVTGPETVSVRDAADQLGRLLKKEPQFIGEEKSKAYLNNAGKAIRLFGYPKVGINELIEMQGDWILSGGRSLGKATHFEERGGNY